MKMKRIYGIVFVLLSLYILGCDAQSTITKSQAMDAVRAFENDSNLQLQVDEYEEAEDGYAANNISKTYYVSETIAPSRNFRWEVNAVTGEVLSAEYLSRISQNESDNPYGQYTKLQCKQFALDFGTCWHWDCGSCGPRRR